jgi:hypothetical protein
MVDHLKPTRVKLSIMSALATGWLPWGVNWQRNLGYDGKTASLCCGHTLSRNETAAFLAAGLLRPEADDPNRLEITDAGRQWLGRNWGI